MENREQFLAERLSGMGGSDAAAICGLNPYKSALQVWREKVGLHVTEESEAMFWGTALEPVILKRYDKIVKERYGETAEVIPGEFFRHIDHPFLIAHCDGVLVNRQNGSGPQVDTAFGIVEVKTAGDRMKGDWGEEWSDDIPQAYLTQVQHYLGVTGLDFCHVAVLFGGHEFRIYEVKANPEFIASLFELETRFWNEHVVPQVPPPPDGSESAKKMLDEMYPADTGATVEATGEVIEWVEEFFRQRKAEKLAKEKKEEAQNHVIAFMGEAAILTGPDFKITYKTDKEKEVVDYKCAVNDLLQSKDVDDHIKGVVRDYLGAYTETKAGSRRFLAKFEE